VNSPAFWYEKAAAQDNALAMLNLGNMSLRGEGTKVNYDEARSWYEKAAALGRAEGMTGIGLLYRDGKGVPTRVASGERLIQKARDHLLLVTMVRFVETAALACHALAPCLGW
jgi:TPR repeat protein